MLNRILRRGTLVASASAVTLLATVLTAQAASSPGWRIVGSIGAPDYPNPEAIAASGPANAWISGITENFMSAPPTSSLFFEQWNGTTWQRVAPPAQFINSSVEQFGCFLLGTSGPNNNWFFPTGNGTSNTNYALRWDGSTWTTFTLPSDALITASAVNGPADVWVFGSVLTTATHAPPWAMRYNGHSWQPAAVPGLISAVSAPAASDMWAVGTTAGSHPRNIAMHWNGRSWSTIHLPAPAQVNGAGWSPTGVVAHSISDAWVQESPAAGPGPAIPGMALEHWNGKKWILAAENTKDHFYAGMASDGHGGFWLPGAATGGPNPNAFIFHYTGGKLTSQPQPVDPGYNPGGVSFAAIPGTASAWAFGSEYQPGNPQNPTDILKYGN